MIFYNTVTHVVSSLTNIRRMNLNHISRLFVTWYTVHQFVQLSVCFTWVPICHYVQIWIMGWSSVQIWLGLSIAISITYFYNFMFLYNYPFIVILSIKHMKYNVNMFYVSRATLHLQKWCTLFDRFLCSIALVIVYLTILSQRE